MASKDIDPRPGLRNLNERAAAGETVFSTPEKKDSSLKKNTGFVKRIRSINQDNLALALTDIKTLSLEKYLSEISVALSECIVNSARNDDALPYLEVISALYQRFGNDIVAPILSALVDFLLAKPIGDALSRHKFVLKFVFHMYLVGLCSTFMDCSSEHLTERATKMSKSNGPNMFLILPLLKNIMSFEPSQGSSLGVVVSFVRAFKDILGPEESPLLPPDAKREVLQLLTLYANEIVKLLILLRKDTLVKKERSRKASIRTGKVLEDLQLEVDTAIELENTFDMGAKVLCELVDVDYPSFQEPNLQEDKTSVDANTTQTAKQDCWEDSQDRDFHLILPTDDDIEKAVGPEVTRNLRLEELTEGERVVKLLAFLENSVSELDILVCTVVMRNYVPYNKATRNKFLKFFSFESKNADNVNLYAKFLKINEEQLSEVISDVTAMLDQGFRSQMYHGRINFRTISFFVELVKFKLIPKHVVFHKIRKLTLDLAGTNNAVILLIFYQDCGKFLLFEPEYRETTQDMLDLLRQRSKSAMLSMDEKHVIKNMFCIIESYINPKQKESLKEPLVSPIEDYLAQILKVLVTPDSFSMAKSLFQEIDFSNDVEAQKALYSLFQKPEELNSDNYDLLAKLLLEGGRKRKFLASQVVNGLVELVYRGLENNDYRNNAARTSQLKILASFYNNNVLGIQSVIDLLFRIICFGHLNNLPTPAPTCETDKPNDYFRLFLCCTMLKRMDFALVKSTDYYTGLVKSLEGFIVFLHYYSFCKLNPLPRDIDLLLADVYQKFNAASSKNLELGGSFGEAAKLFQDYTHQCGIEAAKSQTAKGKSQPKTEPKIGQTAEHNTANNTGKSLENNFKSKSESKSESESEIKDTTSDTKSDTKILLDDDEPISESDSDSSDDSVSTTSSDDGLEDESDLLSDSDSEGDSEDDSNDDSDGESVSETERIIKGHVDSENELEISFDSDDESYDYNIDEEDEEQRRIRDRIEALKVIEEKRLISAVDKSIQELRQDTSLVSKTTRSLRMPTPSAFGGRVGGSHSPGMKLNFLSKSNKLREMNIPTSKLLDERILKEQEERRANQQKILSLVDQMD